MDSQNKKSDLLGQLKIDREVPVPQSSSESLSLINPYLALVVLVLTVALSVYFFTYNHEGKTQTNEEQLLLNKTTSDAPELKINTVDLVEPTSNLTEDTEASVLNASGYITAQRIATVSAEFMGRIVKVNVEEGMKVTEGQVLAELDDTIAKISLQTSEAQIRVMQAIESRRILQFQEAKRNYDRISKNPYSTDAEISIALTEFKSAEIDVAHVKADIEVALLQIAEQKERLDDFMVKAPFSGVVTVKNAQPGEIVSPSSAGGGFTRTGICTIVDMDSLEIEVDVNEAFIGRVYKGQTVEARLDAYPDWIIPATVEAIIPTADKARATVQVRIKIEQLDARVLPEMGVKVAFLKNKEIKW